MQLTPFLDCRALAGWIIDDYCQIEDFQCENPRFGTLCAQKAPQWRLLNKLPIYSLKSTIFGQMEPYSIGHQWVSPIWGFSI